MRFAVALPWWGYVLAFGAALVVAWIAYARTPVALPARRRAVLTALRAATLLFLVVVLLRPVQVLPPSPGRDRLVPVLVDVSRSMRLADGNGPARLEQAAALVRDLLPRLDPHFRTEVLTFGEALERGDVALLQATARRSDLSGALAALTERYRGQPLAGVVVVSDGGDTALQDAGARVAAPAPVFAVGVGNTAPARDREVVELTAGEPRLADASVDLSVAAVSHGFGATPLEFRVAANGRPIEVRKVPAGGDGSPVHTVFTVSPDADGPTVYTVELPVAPGELVAENNTRSVLVEAPGRKRRLLVLEGGPGYEHTFLKRALARDTGLEIDAVVRKGQSDDGRPTYFVQAAQSRAEALAGGFPARRADLFQYDGLILANVEAETMPRAQLELAAEFLGRRGGGVLVMGARAFERQGLAGTPLAEALPVDFTDRRAPVARVARVEGPDGGGVQLTPDGAQHPVTRIAATGEESRRRWQTLPPLASVAAIGGPRPGAQVLAVAPGAAGEALPLIAAQRYGQGRAVVFAGEAAWRWRMQLPAADTTYETIWRQMARWLTTAAPEPVAIAPLSASLPATTEPLSVLVRDRDFTPVRDAEVRITVEQPGGGVRELSAALTGPEEGRYTASLRLDQPGVYRLRADARRRTEVVGTASRAALVGGVDVEMADPRLNVPVLQRVASASGGAYVPLADAGSLVDRLRSAQGADGPPGVRDLWHNGVVLAVLIALLASEWVLRRRWGLA
jgi:uncharacterized membrane protein